jgi:hypothetical protein
MNADEHPLRTTTDIKNRDQNRRNAEKSTLGCRSKLDLEPILPTVVIFPLG